MTEERGMVMTGLLAAKKAERATETRSGNLKLRQQLRGAPPNTCAVKAAASQSVASACLAAFRRRCLRPMQRLPLLC